MNFPSLDRRTVLSTAAWATPAVVLASSAPAFADSNPSTAPCVLTSTPVSWSSVNATVPNGLHDSNETGWMAGTATSAGALISSAHANSFTNTRPYDVTNVQVPSPITLPAGSFVSWANNTSQTGSTFIRVRWSFSVSGNATVTFASQLLMQYGNPAGSAARQTLVVRVTDGAKPAVVAGRVAARREANGGPHPDIATGPHTKTDAQLVAEGYTLIPLPNNYPRRYLVDWNTPPVSLTSASTGSRIVTVEYEFELHSLNNTFTINDDLAVLAPTVLDSAPC